MSVLVQIRSTVVVIFVLITTLIPSAVPHCSKLLQKISVDEPSKTAAARIFKSFIGDNGRVYACSGKSFYAFESNGSIAWRVYLKYTCNANISPVHGGSSKIYVVAENRVLKLYPLKVGTSEPTVEVFFGPAQGKDEPGEIIGICASISSSYLLITVKNRGLFAFKLHGELIWSAGPVLYQQGYRQGCRKNITECYFTSAPVIDHCEASIFILNTVGELYSLSVRGPYFKWIKDISSFGNKLTITPGNNGLLYVIAPESTLVLALNASTGNILWRGSLGPLSSTDYEPVVDANGWISFGSLDGYLYSFSPTGDLRKFPQLLSPDSVIQVNPVLDCSGHALYISKTEMEGKNSQTIAEYTYVSVLKPKNVVFTLLVPASGLIYWSESANYECAGTSLFKLSQSDLQYFVLDERTLLTFFSASRIGNPSPCHSTYQRLSSSCSQVKPSESITIYTGNERTIILFLVIESVALVFLTAAVQFCCIFWKKKKLQDQNLGKFLEKRRSLKSQEKAFDQMITELEQKEASLEAAPAGNEVAATLSDLVRGREVIRRKLATEYSLGKDVDNARPESLLPMSDSSKGSRKGSASSETTTSGEYGSPLTEDQDYFPEDENRFLGSVKGKGKAPAEAESSSGVKRWISNSPSASGGCVSSLFMERYYSFSEIQDGDVDENAMENRHGSLRRRTMSMSCTH